MSARKVTITVKEHADGLSIDLHIPAYMRDGIAATMAHGMVMIGKEMGDDFARSHGLPVSTMKAGKSPADPFKQ